MLKSLYLQNFRNYPKVDFEFSPQTTLVIGPNTAGKSNLMEAIFLVSTGKSSRADKDPQMISFGKEVGRVKARVDDFELEVVLTTGNFGGEKSQLKKFLVNGVAKRRIDFAGNLTSVLFSPQDLDIIIDSPSLRRNFLDNVLEQTDREYALANIAFIKALRQRNALLELARERGGRKEPQFEYWDNQVIENGQILTAKREEFIKFVNISAKEILDFVTIYDKSIISKERLAAYEQEELASAVTLVGPHRDDFSINLSVKNNPHDIRFFGSRGQQRLTILQLKKLELNFIEQKLGKKPILLLDDIFSELDSGHIELILSLNKSGQTIISTTHKEFVSRRYLKDMEVIKLS